MLARIRTDPSSGIVLGLALLMASLINLHAAHAQTPTAELKRREPLAKRVDVPMRLDKPLRASLPHATKPLGKFEATRSVRRTDVFKTL